MIVAGPDGFQKNQYRKFNIRSADLAPGDDFGMMREVLTRRFKRLLNEAPRANGKLKPDGHGAAEDPIEIPATEPHALSPSPLVERVVRSAGPSRVRGMLRSSSSRQTSAPHSPR